MTREKLAEALGLLSDAQNALSEADIPGREDWLDWARASVVDALAYATVADADNETPDIETETEGCE